MNRFCEIFMLLNFGGQKHPIPAKLVTFTHFLLLVIWYNFTKPNEQIYKKKMSKSDDFGHTNHPFIAF